VASFPPLGHSPGGAGSRPTATALARRRRATRQAQILDALSRGDAFASSLSGEELESAWRRFSADVASVHPVARSPRRAARLRDAAAESERVQELVDWELTAL